MSFSWERVVCCLLKSSILNILNDTNDCRFFFLSFYLFVFGFDCVDFCNFVCVWMREKKQQPRDRERQLITVNQPDWTTSTTAEKAEEKKYTHAHLQRENTSPCWLVIFSIRQHLEDETRWSGQKKPQSHQFFCSFVRSFVCSLIYFVNYKRWVFITLNIEQRKNRRKKLKPGESISVYIERLCPCPCLCLSLVSQCSRCNFRNEQCDSAFSFKAITWYSYFSWSWLSFVVLSYCFSSLKSSNGIWCAYTYVQVCTVYTYLYDINSIIGDDDDDDNEEGNRIGQSTHESQLKFLIRFRCCDFLFSRLLSCLSILVTNDRAVHKKSSYIWSDIRDENTVELSRKRTDDKKQTQIA